MHRHVATCNIREEYHGDIDKSLDTKIKIRYPYVVSFFRQQCSTKVCIKAGHYMYTVGAALEGGGGMWVRPPPLPDTPSPLAFSKYESQRTKLTALSAAFLHAYFKILNFILYFFYIQIYNGKMKVDLWQVTIVNYAYFVSHFKVMHRKIFFLQMCRKTKPL